MTAAVCCLAAVSAQAQSTPDTAASRRFGHNTIVPSATAARRSGAVLLDGRLDEPAWRAAAPITDFTQSDPDEGKPPSQRTEVRFLYDDAALYIGAKMYDNQGPMGVSTRLVRRDASFDSDILDIEIDSYHDHLSRAIFQVNPAGSKADQIGIGTSCCDESWDPVWEVATHIDEDGWTAELRIPYSQLRFPHDTMQVWGLQLARPIKRRDETDLWVFNKKSETGGPSRYGHLFGIRVPASSQHIELLPYAVTKSSWVAGAAGRSFQ